MFYDDLTGADGKPPLPQESGALTLTQTQTQTLTLT